MILISHSVPFQCLAEFFALWILALPKECFRFLLETLKLLETLVLQYNLSHVFSNSPVCIYVCLLISKG